MIHPKWSQEFEVFGIDSIRLAGEMLNEAHKNGYEIHHISSEQGQQILYFRKIPKTIEEGTSFWGMIGELTDLVSDVNRYKTVRDRIESFRERYGLDK